jgi:hypothetical protein
MEDSDTFVYILEEGEKIGFDKGRLKEAKRFLLVLGTKRFGEPDEATLTLLTATTDLERLHRLHDRLFEATNCWQDLLDTP